MSEAMEKVKEVRQLPLFPLPLVLLPIEILPLHIFEPRYREMLSDATSTNNLFGVHLFEPKDEFDSRPAIGTVGCVAEVREVQTMPDGRSNILTNGLVRYRLLNYVDTDKPYLVGEVEFFEDEIENAAQQQKAADEVFALFERIARAAFKMSGNRGQFPEIERAAPEPMSFLVTAAFSFDNKKKYRFLEMDSTIKRLKGLKKMLVSAADQMETSAEITEMAKSNGHSNKKLDL
ncbi:MAG: LON peptidase substrate-binding domain-containing protein [Pyrinomonadaceae bacterium]